MPVNATETREPSPARVDDDRIVEAVRAEVVAHGLRRATVTSIAKRAGVSRATLHRRAPGVQRLVLDTLVGDFGALVAAAMPAPEAHPHARARLVATVRGCVEQLWANSLVTALLEHDPELLLPYLVERIGASQRVVLALVRAQVDDGQHDGSIRAGDAGTLTLSLVQAVGSFVIGRRLFIAASDSADWAGEAAALVDRYLHPGLLA